MADDKRLTTWARIEPHTMTTDINVGLAAEVADPLWFLARQWQLGEFTGSDGGSPIDVALRASWTPLSRYQPGLAAMGLPISDYSADMFPLERQVEAEPAERSVDWRTAALWGQRLEQAVGSASVIAALRAAFPLSAPRSIAAYQTRPNERRCFTMFAGGTDGALAFASAALAQMADIRSHAPDPAEFDRALSLWTEAIQILLGPDALEPAETPAEPRGPNPPAPPSWQAERLEYAFSIAAAGFDAEQTLTAQEYDGTGLDWYHLDIDPAASLGAVGAPVVDQNTRHFLPKSVSFHGMPADRFWEMEDGLIDLGTVDAGPTDLARLLATEYAVIYSPDWFVVPLELPIGCLARVDWIVVTDTFGVSTLVGTKDSQRDDAGRMFQLSTVTDQLADIPCLFLPPAALYGQQSQPLEELLIERDEQANLAWIIQKAVVGSAGRPVQIDPGTPPAVAFDGLPEGAEEPDLAYILATWVPNGWIPMVPVPGEGGADPNVATMLERGLLLDTVERKLRTVSGVLGVGLDRVHEEEVRRDGVRLRMTDQLARWYDGEIHLWRGRQKLAGRGESHAGLYFDATRPKST